MEPGGVIVEYNKSRITVLGVVLFLAALGIGFSQALLPQGGTRHEFVFEDEPSFILTEDDPSYSYQMYPVNVTQVEIASITTNDTYITVSVKNSTDTKLVLHNITRLRNLPVIIAPENREQITITFSRIDETASVRVKILMHRLIPPPVPVVFSVALVLPVILICAGFWVGYYLVRAHFDCWKPGLESSTSLSYSDRVGPLAVIVFMILSAALISPLLSGIVRNDYSLKEEEVQLDQLAVQGTLNESNAVLSYNFTEIANSYDTSIERIIVHSFQFSEASLRIKADIGEEPSGFRVNESYSSTVWWLRPDFQEQPCMLYLHRIDEDVEVSFEIQIMTIDEVLKNDPTVPAILAACGVLVFVLGLYRSWQIEKALKEAPETETQ